MKYLAVAMLCLTCGCGALNPNRSLFGDNIVGQNVELGKKSIEASMVVHRDASTSVNIGNRVETISECLDQSGTLLSSVDQQISTVAPDLHNQVAAELRQMDTLLGTADEELEVIVDQLKEHERNMKELAEYVEFTNKAAQGKTYKSKTKILMYQILGVSTVLFILAAALAAFGLLRPFRAFLGGLFGLAADISNGGFAAMKETVAEMADKDTRIDKAKLHPSLKASIVNQKLKKEE